MSAPAKSPEPLDTSLPSIRQIQSYIRDKQVLEIKLRTGDTLQGKVIWQDPDCLYLVDSTDQKILLWRDALVFMKAQA
jgi:host factor-I protein